MCFFTAANFSSSSPAVHGVQAKRKKTAARAEQRMCGMGSPLVKGIESLIAPDRNLAMLDLSIKNALYSISLFRNAC
jgi:hypothetical protein